MSQEITAASGFVYFYGITPAINVLEDSVTCNITLKSNQYSQKVYREQEEVNVLLLGTSDPRHIMKTLFYIQQNMSDWPEKKKINFYVFERNKELLCRMITLFHVLQVKNLPVRERVEMFFDIYGNCLTREKTCQFIDMNVERYIKFLTFQFLANLLQNSLVTDEETNICLKRIFGFKNITFKNRDEMVEIFYSWAKKEKFDMEVYRDQRMRYLHGERYDYRRNMADYDYHFKLAQTTEIVNYRQYLEWRQSGVAFESRFSTYIMPNRTMSSYIPGIKKKSRDKVLIRGYYGDIVISPYIGFGLETTATPEDKYFFKTQNMTKVYSAMQISWFNVARYIKKWEQNADHQFDFSQLGKDYTTHMRKENKSMEKIKEEVVEEEIKIEKPETKKPKPEKKTLTLDQIKEGQKKQAEQENAPPPPISEKQQKIFDNHQEKIWKDFIPQDDKLLDGLDKIDFKINFLTDDLDKHMRRKKFQKFFDVAVLGFVYSANLTKPEFKGLLKENGKLYAEAPIFQVPLKKEEQPKLKEAMLKQAKENEFILEEFGFKHHFKFGVKK